MHHASHGGLRLSVLTLLAAGMVASGVAVADEASAWADQVWAAAMEGRNADLASALATPPGEGLDAQARQAYLLDVTRWQRHESDDDAFIAERKAQAREEMFTAAADDDLLESLRLLLEIQTLDGDFNAPLADPEIRALIDRVERQIDQWRADGRLFFAQQAILRLRAVFEDTADRDAWLRLSDDYETMADQMRLLRRYRFPEFHRRYVAYNRDRGEEVESEYSPLLNERWRDEVRGADMRTVLASLEIAMAEHVEAEGYRPMIKGGIDALRVLTADAMLEDTFPALGDEAAIVAWDAALDAIEAELEIPGLEISVDRVLQRLAQSNVESVKLPEAVLWREFTDGAMDELDRFTQVIWPFDFEQFERQMRGKFVGVGVQIQETEIGEIKVVTPLEGKPAFYAGVKADDIIVEVDGESTTGWTVHDAVRHITGPADTAVEIGLRREGEDDLVNVSIVRDVIKMPTVQGWRKLGIDDRGREDWNWFVDEDDGVGYIKLTGFDQETNVDLLRAIAEMRTEQDLNGMVLDLRFNPGGLLERAAFVSNLFLPEGDIVTGEDRTGRRTFAYPARPINCYLGGVPTVVLINRGSASASEIVAGCLQAHDAAIVLGERSFGKGSVQTVHPVAPEARIKVTNQYYRLPSDGDGAPGRLVHKRPGARDWGVVPDLIVPMTVDDIDASQRMRVRAERAVSALPLPEDDDVAEELEPVDLGEPDIDRLITDGYDPQLELAVLLLQAQVLADSADPGQTPARVAGGEVEDLRGQATRSKDH